VIAGAGGGLGHIAVQLAKGMGLRIIDIDHSSKEAFVKECGAEAFLDITKHDDKSIVEESKKLLVALELRHCWSA
jgi:propanol-preferring alcohol dehydrogenase